MNDNNFQQDLLTGQKAEQKFAGCAEQKLGATNIIFNNSTDITELRKGDLKYTNPAGCEISFEVKHDLLSTTTGNFAIEFGGTNNASGIDATTANFGVILSGINFYIFKTADLKQLIKANSFRSLQIKNGTAYCYLVPIETAKAVATKILSVL